MTCVGDARNLFVSLLSLTFCSIATHSWGGDLYCRDPYTEAEAARITSSVLSAVSYMHSKNFCHRDLKFENILFSSTSPQAEVKLIDFGLSTFGNEVMTDGVGTM